MPSRLFHTETTSVIPDEERYIAETLNIYNPEYIYLRRFAYADRRLSGEFTVEHYPFTKPIFIHYMTASMLCLYLSQLGYLFARMCADGLFPKLRPEFTSQQFFSLRNAGAIYITNLTCSFHEPVDVGNTASVTLEARRFLRVAGKEYADGEFSVNGRASFGKLRVLVDKTRL